MTNFIPKTLLHLPFGGRQHMYTWVLYEESLNALLPTAVLKMLFISKCFLYLNIFIHRCFLYLNTFIRRCFLYLKIPILPWNSPCNVCVSCESIPRLSIFLFDCERPATCRSTWRCSRGTSLFSTEKSKYWCRGSTRDSVLVKAFDRPGFGLPVNAAHGVKAQGTAGLPGPTWHF